MMKIPKGTQGRVNRLGKRVGGHGLRGRRGLPGKHTGKLAHGFGYHGRRKGR